MRITPIHTNAYRTGGWFVCQTQRVQLIKSRNIARGEVNSQSMPNPILATLRKVFSTPHPVNEYAARMVAGMVVALSLVIVLLEVPWLMFFLAYGFLAGVFARCSTSTGLCRATQAVRSDGGAGIWHPSPGSPLRI